MENLDLSKLTIEQHERIAEVMDSFDFNTVEKYMNDTNWEWAYGDEYVIPTNSDLRRRLRTMLVRCFNDLNESNDTVVWNSTGGFTVYVHQGNECEAYFSIADYISGI